MSHPHADDEKWMALALAAARDAVLAGQAPFGAAIIKAGRPVSVRHNTVAATGDPTAHAEMEAIRAACDALETDTLAGCQLYTTCEPCPMCFAAAHFAKIDRIVFGATIGDAALGGYEQLAIFATQLKALGRSPIEITAEFMREACADLLRHNAPLDS